jgi:hypothetical protein
VGYLESQSMASRGGDVPPTAPDGQSRDTTLTGISVAYHNELRAPKVRMTKTGRAAARQNLKPFGMSSTRKRIRPSDPAQNNPNDIGAKIIPQGQGPL